MIRRRKIAVIVFPIIVFCLYSFNGIGQKNNIGQLQAPEGLMCDLIAHTDYQSINGYPVQPVWNAIAFEQHQAVRIGSKNPTFSWIVKDAKSNVLQTAYQILVSDNLDSLRSGKGNLWNSEEQLSDQSSSIAYGGKALEPHTVYYWKVRVWNNYGEESLYSAIAAFFTDSLLKAHVTARYPLEKSLEYPKLFRKVKGAFWADFGKDAFGQLKLRLFSDKEQDTIIIHLGEALRADGRIDSLPGGSIRYSSYLLPLKEGWHTYQLKIRRDQFNTRSASIKMPDYVGEVTPFRYCEVEGYNHPLDAHDLIREAVNYPFDDQAAAFHSSDSTLNAIWELCKYSMRATSFAGIFVDGDRERIPYEADAYINQLGYYSVDREYSLARHSHEYLIDHATWPTEWILMSVLMAWNDYMYTGDLRSVTHYYDDLKAKTLMGLQDSTGLISTRTGLQTPQFLKSIHFNGNSLRDIVDWPHDKAPGTGQQIQGETDGFIFTDYNSVVNAFYYEAVTVMAELAKAIGHNEDAARLTLQAKNIRRQYQRLFWDPKHQRYCDGIGTTHASLHANMFAMAFGLVKDEYKKSVISFIRSRGMACSVYGSQFLLDAVYEAGGADYGLSLLTSRGERSWYNMLRAGSTITMEAWDNKYKPNQDWNHAWGATPANIIPQELMGIKPLKPTWSLFSICPQPGGLTWADITVPTIKGSVHLKFRNHENTFQMEVEIPANTIARVSLPLRARKYKEVQMDGQVLKIIPKEINHQLAIGEVGSGKHIFRIVYK